MISDLNVDRFLAGKPLALTMSGLEELRAHILARIAVFDSGPRDFLAGLVGEMKAANGDQQRRPRARDVGIIQIRGTISQHAKDDFSSFLFGGTTTEGVTAAIRKLVADDDIGKIVLDIDSPGGGSYGVAELASEIRSARAQKPVIAVANSVAASASYWIGAQASEFYATPGALVGSIGVYALHMDLSAAAEKEGVKPTFISAGEYKTEFNEFSPLSDAALEHVQGLVDDTYNQFIADVARGRGVTEATVRNSYGKGRVLTAKQAKSAGMIDGIYTIEQAIARQPKAARPVEEEVEQAAEAAELEQLAQEEDTAVLERQRAFQAWKLRAFMEDAELVGAAAGGSLNGNQG